ncbi:hypothetical protein ES707_15325 [subsurface metagenome]
MVKKDYMGNVIIAPTALFYKLIVILDKSNNQKNIMYKLVLTE